MLKENTISNFLLHCIVEIPTIKGANYYKLKLSKIGVHIFLIAIICKSVKAA